ncbi:MAG: RNA-binding protein [Rhizobium sp. 63-7]|mgnify:CR=1 FL=1|nr:MAG: RNA-binding protein [Rhizobium sp. 63-7]
MNALPFAFANPAVLFALLSLPVIWWLLRLTPPRPQTEAFPPLKILASVLKREETPAQSPWWLTLLRMLLAAAVILALADPVVNQRTSTLATGPMVLLVDNSWASAADWQRRLDTAHALVDDAEAQDVPVSTVFTADRNHDATPANAATAREKLAAAGPQPLVPDRRRALQAIRESLGNTTPGTVAFLSDGVKSDDTDTVLADLATLKPQDLRLIEGDGTKTIALTAAANGADQMTVSASRLAGANAASFNLIAQDGQGRPIASGALAFAAGETAASGTIAAPFEMRNDFARISIEGQASAGSVHLLDDGFKRRRVALLTGEAGDDFQPLLSPLYYINRALQPYADLIEPKVPDLAQSIPEILAGNPSVIIMADIGRLPAETYEPMQRWIANGGTLIRFAGPRLAAAPADDPLVPVILRQGERAFGGALSWAEPQPLADFPAFGPFAGMARPDGILVKRQVLAEPTPDLAERTWASLADGTPLVTVRNVNGGRIVLFHVSAEATWSDLPISGHFVEMLRRIVQLSRSGGASAETGAAKTAEALPPFRLLTAEGVLSTETGDAKPLDPRRDLSKVASTFDNPPGLYGSEDGFTALNLLPAGATLQRLDPTTAGMTVTLDSLIGEKAWSAKPALFTLAFLLLVADTLIVLFMGGAFARRLRPAAGAAMILVLAFAAAALMPMSEARADDSKPGDDVIMERLNNTHLAYVITGEPDVDRMSELGLNGLTDYLTYRTTLEPSPPVGVDISKDELSLFPIIYWPISASAPMPSTSTISRIDAYMRAGGTVLFDTRDQFSALDTSGAPTANGERLQAILGNLDIPPLEPVPTDHVLTKSFYLLSNFPGRYSGSPLWIEARQDARNGSSAGTQSGDGVSPIMITGNDFAGAWAIDANGAAVLPTVPPDETQRDYAFRTGVNIMMYMLTGNYKADQVHIPALLERLGQ